MTLARLNPDAQRRHEWRNRLHTWIMILGSGLLMALIAWSVLGLTGLVYAAVFGAVGLWSASRISPRMVLKLYKAQPLTPQELPEVQRILRTLTARADLPTVPSLYYVPSRMMNAFAVGRPDDSAIAVTDGLLRGLSQRQLAGVLAHEVSHVRSGDLKVMALGDILSRITGLMAQVGLFGLLFSLPTLLSQGYSVPWLGLALLILAPTIGGLLQLALSRTREYDADLDAAALTGDPEGLAGALLTLEKRQGKLWEGLVLPGSRLPDPSILRSHPKTEDRVRRLLSLRHGGHAPLDLPETPPAMHRPSGPLIRPPRIHWGRMGIYY